MTELHWDDHRRYLLKHVERMSVGYVYQETTRPTMLYFVLSGLDIMDAVNEIPPEKQKRIIDWVYSLQITESQSFEPCCIGFRGSHSIAVPHPSPNDGGHLVMTYSAIMVLAILRDDFSRLDRKGILKGVQACQLEDGSFRSSIFEQADMRFVYAAVAVCAALQDFSLLNIPKLIEFIKSCLSYEGAFGQHVGAEAHGGSTYCAVASLYLLGRLDDSSVLSSKQKAKLIRWCVYKQRVGFHGRVNKDDDSCYTFWIGASLRLLGAHELIDLGQVIRFASDMQQSFSGGFSREPDCPPDVLHTYMTLAGLSALGYAGMPKFQSALNITQKTAEYLLSCLVPTQMNEC